MRVCEPACADHPPSHNDPPRGLLWRVSWVCAGTDSSAAHVAERFREESGADGRIEKARPRCYSMGSHVRDCDGQVLTAVAGGDGELNQDALQ